MTSQSKLNPVLKKSENLCRECLRQKQVRFNLGDVQTELNSIAAARSRIMNKLLHADHLKTGKLILYKSELDRAISFLERKYHK